MKDAVSAYEKLSNKPLDTFEETKEMSDNLKQYESHLDEVDKLQKR